MFDMMPRELYNADFNRSAETQLSSGANSLFAKIFDFEKTAGSVTPVKNETLSSGQIDSMNVPVNWLERPPVRLQSGAGLIEYHAPNDSDVRLNSYYRGNRISDEGAKAFKKCLADPTHEIAKGSEELASLAEVLDGKTRNFNVSKAFTDELNGKKVLIVEGSYKDAEHTTSRTVFIDSDGSGSAIQELAYSAPGASYNAHLPEAEKSIKSIKWK